MITKIESITVPVESGKRTKYPDVVFEDFDEGSQTKRATARVRIKGTRTRLDVDELYDLAFAAYQAYAHLEEIEVDT